MIDIDVIDRGRAEVGEGPVWDARTGELHWVDILRGEIRTDRLDGEPAQTLTLDTQVGAVLPAEDPGEWLICARDGFRRVDRASGLLRKLDAPLSARPGMRFNDGKVGPGGVAFGGTMPYEADAESGALYRLDDGGAATPVVAPLRLANGLGWSPDGREMYVIDSGSKTLFRAPYDADSADLGRAAPLIEFALPEGALPDGMCVDDGGGIWVAIMGGGRVERYTPAGELDRTIELPLERPTSLCFAGLGLDTLVVTSLSYLLGEAELERDPLAGTLLAIDVGCTGPAATPWNPSRIGLARALDSEEA